MKFRFVLQPAMAIFFAVRNGLQDAREGKPAFPALKRRAKLQEIKQQLRARMLDATPDTGTWLRAVVQGHFNYYAVPGNLDSLGMFRERVLSMWWHVLCRRTQKRGVTWERMIAIAKRWLPSPRVLHPYPAQRFAAHHPR